MNVISVDVGGSKIAASKIELHPKTQTVKKNSLQQVLNIPTKAKGSKQEVLEQIIQLIDTLIDNKSVAITLGVPSSIDSEKKKIISTTNIKNLQNVNIVDILHKKYGIAIFMENDANCFALSQHRFGKAKKFQHSVGITLGTGFGAGIIINDTIYLGHHHEAGEFGKISFKDKTIEEYVSGKFFENTYNKSAKHMYEDAKKGVKLAKKAFEEFAKNLAQVLFAIQETFDPEIIVLGGSLCNAKKFIQTQLKRELKQIKKENHINITYSFASTKNDVLLGAALLCEEINN